MTKGVKALVTIGAIIAVLIVCLSVFFSVTPTGKALWNNWFHAVQKADDATNYETLKKVEDSCRAMISTYQKNALEYESNMKLYQETGNEYYLQVATGNKQQANQTASTYNNYILKNRYVWKDAVPSDIKMSLDFLQ